MYVEGTCTGMFELLEVIKTTAISAGWKVVGEKEVLYNDIPRDAKYCIPDGDIYSIKQIKQHLQEAVLGLLCQGDLSHLV